MQSPDFNRQPLEARTSLMKDIQPHHSGFVPRSVQKLVHRKVPRTSLNIECKHYLRNSVGESAHGHLSVPYRLWIEAGKHEAPIPDKPDPNYNSNVWRNFQRQYGFYPNTKGQNIDQMIASMYPLNVPAPSRVGQYNYAKFLTETPTIRNEKLRKLAIDRTTKDIVEFKRLRLKTESRNPPIDQTGNIKPPLNFRKYAHRFIPPDAEPVESSTPQPAPNPADTKIDMFGRQVPKGKTSGPYLWKISYKLTNPQYKQVHDEMDARKFRPRQHPPAVTSLRVS
ncbi:hypothetical protein CAPTEDRAFT_208890 [Capitella teleta]|uniref:Uncharacterized protein n=1 Tax=Capitella teleta TaxID=283909 RepID=R7UNR0_CAPTE|nr:hypothetical protein CAPTEDRAFT_208890 [Capitella teleta]|eukprot:ELU08169.1 hypothetical protein CAPTEDRAFT_208890 [Capitella teleta]